MQLEESRTRGKVLFTVSEISEYIAYKKVSYRASEGTYEASSVLAAMKSSVIKKFVVRQVKVKRQSARNFLASLPELGADGRAAAAANKIDSMETKCQRNPC